MHELIERYHNST